MKCKKLTKQEVANKLFKAKVPLKKLGKQDMKNVTLIWKSWNKACKSKNK